LHKVEDVAKVVAFSPNSISSVVRRILAWVLFLFALFLTIAISEAFAAQHPVQLDPKADSSTCVSCHEDKTKGKAVHSAMATGCTSCHEIRNNRDTTHVRLITATPYKLCLSCHADKDATQIKGHVHEPAVRDCLKCHDPHTSEIKNQLVKATSGDSGKDNLCLTCHAQGTNVPEKGSRHAALDTGCDTCHTTHKSGDPSKTEFAFHLTKPTPQLCLDCHDPKDASLQKAHANQPLAGSNCVQCHDPHQSRAPKLMQAFLHNPFENNLCDSCHQAPKDGKVVLTQASSKAVCVTCHEDKAKEIDSAKVQHPGAADCVDCHNPHAGKTPGFLQPDPVNACLNCHSQQSEEMKKSGHHQPAFGLGCATCHEPHGSDNEHLLRAKGNALCLECHGPESRPQKLEAEHVITIFNGKVKLPEDYYKKNRVELLAIAYGAGHPTARHPVQDIVDPTDASKVKTPMSCLSCHQPHASAQPDLLVKDQANNQAFCDSCHKNRLALTNQDLKRR